MEDLSKTQFLLLVLLVTFVVSIATGIITSSLLDQAPAEVTQTINRVVERTVERVVPSETVTSGGKETVVVTDEDLILSSVEKLGKNLVKITRTSNLNTSDTSTFGLGTILSKGAIVVSGNKNFTNNTKYEVVMSDGKKHDLAPIDNLGRDQGLVFFIVDKDAKTVFSGATLSSSDVKLGQTVVSVSGAESNTVLVGRVSNVVTENSNISSIETDIRGLDDLLGTPVVGLSGEIAGFRKINPNSEVYNAYIPARIVRDLLSQAEKMLGN